MDQLRDDATYWRNQACDLEDKLQWHSDAIADALQDKHDELETLRRESSSARNVIALWDAQKAQSSERCAREKLEQQLCQAAARIEKLEAQAIQTFGVTEPFELRAGGFAALKPGGSRLREVGDAADKVFLTAMEMIVPDDPEGVFKQLMAKPSFRDRLSPPPFFTHTRVWFHPHTCLVELELIDERAP